METGLWRLLNGSSAERAGGTSRACLTTHTQALGDWNRLTGDHNDTDALWLVLLCTTCVVIVSLGVGGLVVVAYLLFPPVRRSLDRQMNRQDEQIWADT